MVLRAFDNELPLQLLPSDDDQQLTAFVQRLFQPAYIGTFDGQIYACTVLLLLSLLVGGSIVLHRVVTGQAWILKLYRTPIGTFVIPNAMLAFLLVEGAFTALWIACMFILLSYTQNGGYATSIFLWRQLVFAPLFIGAWLATWGTLSGFPDALRFKNSSNLHEFYLKPRVFNLCCWVLQLVPIIAIIAPTHLSQQAHSRAHAMYTSSFLSAAAGSDRREIAIDIWREVTRAFWYLSITLTVWTVVILCLAIIYTIISVHVIRRLSYQIRMAIRKHRNPETFFYFSPPLARDEDKMGHSPLPAQRGFMTNSTGNDSRAASRLSRSRGDAHSDQRAIWARKIANLRRIRRMLAIQFGLIEACMFMFVLAALWTASIVYDNARTNTVGRMDSIVWLVVAWSVSIFGIALNVSILSRNHAPLLSLDGQEDSAEVRRIILHPKAWFSPQPSQQTEDPEVHESRVSNRDSTHSATPGDALPLFEVRSSSMDDTDKESVLSSNHSRPPKNWRDSVRSWSAGHAPSTSRIPGFARARRHLGSASEQDHEFGSDSTHLPHAIKAASPSIGGADAEESSVSSHEPATSPVVPGAALLRQALHNTPASAHSEFSHTQPSAYGDWRRAPPRLDGDSGTESESHSPAYSRPGFSPPLAKAVAEQRRPSSRPASSSSRGEDPDSPRKDRRQASAASTAAEGMAKKTLGVRTVAKKLIAEIDGDGEARDVAELPDAKLHFL